VKRFWRKGDKSQNKRRTRERLSIFCNNKVRVRLTFNTIKGTILKNEFSMIRLSFGENWELGLRPILRIEP
jgi:hypothetical protein